jgi:outer membrane protein TolC
MKYLYLAIILFSHATLGAQITMMNDVSPAYLAKLIELGKENYPKFKASAARVNAAKASYNRSKMSVFDFFSLSYVYFPNSNFTVFNNNTATSNLISGYQAGVFVNVGSLLQKPATIKQAKEEYIAVKMEKETLDLDIEQEIRKRYYTYIQYMNIVRIKSKSLADVDDILKNVKYKFEKGETTFDLYNQALLSYSTYSQEKINAEAALLVAKSSLEEILGTTLENIK